MIREKFKNVKRLAKRFPLSDTPIYMEFGRRARADVRRLGHADLQHQGLERLLVI